MIYSTELARLIVNTAAQQFQTTHNTPTNNKNNKNKSSSGHVVEFKLVWYSCSSSRIAVQCKEYA
jgi:hypothetical protein